MDKILKTGYSPCPNDTFIFEALVNRRIDTGKLEFKPVLADVEELNNLAVEGQTDVIKLSYAAYSRVSAEYQILPSGSALGHGVGPILVADRMIDPCDKNITVAIPGINTTANLLLSILMPDIRNKKEYLFSEIADAVMDQDADAGLLIHEGRFTYRSKNLQLICDLGTLWEDKTGLPVPLGCIAVKRQLPADLKSHIGKLIRRSIEFARNDSRSAMPYILSHAQEMDRSVINDHINAYVNEYSIDLGSKGKKAINHMFKLGMEQGLLPVPVQPIFI